MPGVSSTSPSPHTSPPSLKRQHIESSVLSFSSLKQLFGREREKERKREREQKQKLTDLYIVFSARSCIFLSYKE